MKTINGWDEWQVTSATISRMFRERDTVTFTDVVKELGDESAIFYVDIVMMSLWHDQRVEPVLDSAIKRAAIKRRVDDGEVDDELVNQSMDSIVWRSDPSRELPVLFWCRDSDQLRPDKTGNLFRMRQVERRMTELGFHRTSAGVWVKAE